MIPLATDPPRRLRRGPLYMVAASLSFTVMVGLVKVARVELSSIEVIFWRSVIAVPTLWVITRTAGYRVQRVGLLLTRLSLGFVAMSSFYQAARGLSMADLSLISRLQPILVAVAAPLLLGRAERSGPAIWGVLITGLIGCAVLLAPGLAMGSTWGLWALSSAVFSAGAHLSLRAMGPTEDARAVVFWFQLSTLIISGLLLLGTGGLALPPARLWAPLAGVGLTAAAGQLLITRAYAMDRAALVAGASYTAPLFAVVGDVLFFSLIPGVNALLGGALVVAAGLWLIRSPD